MKKFFKKTKEKNVNKKKIIIAISIAIVVIAIIITSIIYCFNETTRDWIDKNIFRKEVLQENVSYIEIEDENAQIHAYSQYIGVLSKNEFSIYNTIGNKEKSINIEITTPIFSSNNHFLAIAEKSGQKAYLITNKDEVWEKKVEGNISQIYVNKNGYVAIVITNTLYKNVIQMYSPEGEELFITVLSSTRISDISISNDNKYLAIAEIDTSGTIIQSTVKIISIAKASQKEKEDTIENTIEKSYKAESNKLITNVNYQDKNKLLCMYTDSINIIENEKDEVISENKDKKITFSSVKLANSSVTIEEKSTGLFTADSILRIANSENREIKEYRVKDVTKDIKTYENVIALNLGTEIEFVNTEGWLIKRYIANQEITNIVISNEVAGIIYRNKIEIIKL